MDKPKLAFSVAMTVIAVIGVGQLTTDASSLFHPNTCSLVCGPCSSDCGSCQQLSGQWLCVAEC